VGREEIALPGVWAQRIAEQCLVGSPVKLIRAAVLFIGPACGEIGHRRDLVVDHGS
jgi:hypothetical protein